MALCIRMFSINISRMSGEIRAETALCQNLCKLSIPCANSISSFTYCSQTGIVIQILIKTLPNIKPWYMPSMHFHRGSRRRHTIYTAQSIVSSLLVQTIETGPHKGVYNLISSEFDGDLPSNCSSSCAYRKEGDTSRTSYCFAPGQSEVTWSAYMGRKSRKLKKI